MIPISLYLLSEQCFLEKVVYSPFKKKTQIDRLTSILNIGKCVRSRQTTYVYVSRPLTYD